MQALTVNQISTFSLGTLGPTLFGLGLKESCLTILFFNLLSTLPVAYFAVFGPRLGLRQMTISRFSFGYYSTYIRFDECFSLTVGASCMDPRCP